MEEQRFDLWQTVYSGYWLGTNNGFPLDIIQFGLLSGKSSMQHDGLCSWDILQKRFYKRSGNPDALVS